MRRPALEKIPIIIDWILFSSAIVIFLFQTVDDFFGVDIDFARFAFVGVCLLIISTVWERRMILTGVDTKLETILKGGVLASQVLRSDKTDIAVSKYLEEARDVSFCGATLSTTIRHYRGEFARLAKKGQKLRFLIVDPEAFPVEREEKQLFKKTALIEFEKLLKEAPAGKVEVRLLDRYPSNKITILQSKKPGKGRILVEMFGYQTSKTDRPYFILVENQDEHWFRFFEEMYETMWNDARPFTGFPG